MMAKNDSAAMVKKLLPNAGCSSVRTASGVFIARSISSPGENSQKVTNTPAARNATSLTIDSVATASIRPC